MHRQFCVIVLTASLVLARQATASSFHLQVSDHHRRGMRDRAASDLSGDYESQEDSKGIDCPAAGDLLTSATKPALTTACPSQCSSSDLCIYFPKKFNSKCVTTSTGLCFHGDSCAYQCVTTTVAQRGWLLTLYDDDAVLDEVNYWNSDLELGLEAIPVNASLVSQWVGVPALPDQFRILFVVGNEAANALSDDAKQDLQDQKSLSLGDIVPFEFPPKFFDAMANVQYLRLENLQFPMPTGKSISNQSFPRLDTLLLRNTMLTSFPFTAASLPALSALDLSVNSITNITRSGLPDSLEFVNLSSNSTSAIHAGIFPGKVTTVDLSSNGIKKVRRGSLPLGLNNLYLDNNLLTEIPADIMEMTSLAQLSLNGNKLGRIPENALPNASLTSLSISNCSLRGVPKAISSMSLLTELNLASNDLSQNLDFSLLPPRLESLCVDNCKLQKLPVGLQNFQRLADLKLRNNPMAVLDSVSLPPNVESMDLNALEWIPSGVKDLTKIVTISLNGNPLRKLSPSTLPKGLEVLYMSEALIQTIRAGTLPQSLIKLQIDNSTVEDAPTDISYMRGLYTLFITNCRLKAIDVIKGLPGLTELNLRNNRISSFSGQYPVLSYLDLRDNSLQSFNVSSSPMLQTLHIAQNDLTVFPSCVFDMPRLLLLNMTGNPIRNFTPSVEQLTILSRISTIVLDQAMFATRCNSSDIIDIRGYKVCTNVTNFDDLKSS